MQQAPLNAIQAIQAILTPAVGISAVGLLLLGLSNRYSSIVNRIRLLNDEKRRLSKELVKEGELGYTDNSRYMSIRTQTQELLARSSLVRNAILFMQGAIGLFLLASIAIGLELFFGSSVFVLPLGIFVLGLLSIFCGVIFAALEVRRSHKIILIEVMAEE